MSVVMYEVTPSRRLEGAKDSATHRARRRIDRLVAGVAGAAARGSPPSRARRITVAAQPPTSNARVKYARAHHVACAARPRRGSIHAGYARSARRLPRLLAAYRK